MKPENWTDLNDTQRREVRVIIKYTPKIYTDRGKVSGFRQQLIDYSSSITPHHVVLRPDIDSTRERGDHQYKVRHVKTLIVDQGDCEFVVENGKIIKVYTKHKSKLRAELLDLYNNLAFINIIHNRKTPMQMTKSDLVNEVYARILLHIDDSREIKYTQLRQVIKNHVSDVNDNQYRKELYRNKITIKTFTELEIIEEEIEEK